MDDYTKKYQCIEIIGCDLSIERNDAEKYTTVNLYSNENGDHVNTIIFKEQLTNQQVYDKLIEMKKGNRI